MALPTNPQTLANYNLLNGGQAKVFVKNVSDILVSIYQFISNPSSFANLLNGTGLINASALVPGSILETNLQTSLNELGSVSAASSTINTNSSSQIFVRVTFTGTTAYTLTLNNLAQGAVIYLRIVNSSGAARTITVAANTPASVAYSMTLYVPATNSLSSGVSVANSTSINAFGMAATTSGVPTALFVGSIG